MKKKSKKYFQFKRKCEWKFQHRSEGKTEKERKLFSTKKKKKRSKEKSKALQLLNRNRSCLCRKICHGITFRVNCIVWTPTIWETMQGKPTSKRLKGGWSQQSFMCSAKIGPFSNKLSTQFPSSLLSFFLSLSPCCANALLCNNKHKATHKVISYTSAFAWRLSKSSSKLNR